MRIFLSLLVIVFLASCTRTTYTQSDSFTDPDFQNLKLTSFLVSAERMKLAEQKAIEIEIAERLGGYNIATLLGSELYLPTRNYDDREKRQIARGSETEAILLITPQGRDVHNIHTYPDRRYGPRVGVYGGSSGVGVGIGVPIGYGYVDEGGFIGGTHFREPEAFYRGEIYTIPNFERIWIGEFSTRGPDGMSWTNLARRFGAELVKKLEEDGLI